MVTMVDRPTSRCWLHPSIEVRPSPIEGRGLFATATLPAGTVVSRLGGRLVDTDELSRLLAQGVGNDQYVDTITVAEDSHLVLPPGTPNGRGNHSCDPNTWWTDSWTLAARRDIKAGDEVTNDYATSTDQATFVMTCSCRSALCRRVVTGDDWRRDDLQERYGDHWIPLLLSRIRSIDASGSG
jgi:SET domain-containing protein